MLPTDKPSRLYKSKITQDVFISDNMSQHGDATYNVNIYITSDEEIKEGDYFLYDETEIRYKTNGTEYHGRDLCHISGNRRYPVNKSKKIILTTDQNLDGVQKIDDEFLQWFVKNPSCEEVEFEVETTSIQLPQQQLSENSYDLSFRWIDKKVYKIIIPKQEQCTCKEHDPYCCQIHGSCPTCVKKEETLEKLAKEYYSDESQLMERIAFKRGYTECKERMYSEEDMKQFAFECVSKFLSNDDNKVEIKLVDVIIDRLNKHFEQFKKK